MPHREKCPACGHEYESENDEFLEQAIQDDAERYADGQRETFD